MGGCGDLGHALSAAIRTLTRFLTTGNGVMVAIEALCGTRIRYTRWLIQHVGGNLVGGGEKGGESSGRCSNEVVDVDQSTCVTDGVRTFR